MTIDQLKQMGCVQQPDGSWTVPGAARPAITPTRPKNETHPARLSHPIPQSPHGQTLDETRRGKEAGTGRLVVRITRCAPRLLDADNFAGGCKPLIDQMRYAGIIPDDDPGSVELQFAQRTVKGKGWTEVEIGRQR